MSAAVAPLLTITDVEATFIAALAVLFAGVWVRGRDPGLPWLVAGFALAAAWYFRSDSLPNTGPNIDTPELRRWAVVIGAAVLCVSTGVVRYLGLPQGPARWLVLACGVPGLALIAALAAGIDVPHRTFHFGVLVAYLGAAALALRRAFDQPGDGNALLGLALLSLATMPGIMAAAGINPQQLKYYAGASLAVFGMVLLTVSLLRRERALGAEVQRRAEAERLVREANARLETRVEERTADLRELIAGLETFNQGVSHDLRGPLGGMSGLARAAAQSLERGEAGPALRALQAIARQCDASVQLVATMLDLARLADVPVQRVPVSLAEIAQAAFDESMLASRPQTLPQLRCHPMPTVMTDPRLLRPVLVNLIGNAVKFTRSTPSPCIDIDATVVGSDVMVRVRDNGVGFGPDVAERIFEPFYRAHGKQFDGHGLGLSIVRRAVQAIGGRVWAEGSAGGGATICFLIPQAMEGLPVSESRTERAGISG